MAACGGPSAGERHDYAIAGVSVTFPCKPYPTQIAMMSKIIQALTRQENALLESPTGSGKSLALLCSALAWQRSEQMRMSSAGTVSPQEISCSCGCHDISAKPTPSRHRSDQPPGMGGGGGGDIVSESKATADTGPLYAAKVEPCAAKVEPCAVKVEPCAAKVEPCAVKVEPGREDKAGTGGRGKEEGGKEEMDDSLEEDFKQTKKRFRTPSAAAGPSSKKRKGKERGVVYEDTCEGEEGESEGSPPVWKMELKSPSAADIGVAPSQIMDTGVTVTVDLADRKPTSHAPCQKCSCPSPEHPKKHPVPPAGHQPRPSPRSSGVPKIFFGSRTHKQIAQITHELNKTAYRGTQMCILASREHMCIHPDVSRSRSKNDECVKLLHSKTDTCMPFHRVQRKLGSQAQLRQYGHYTAWDIEDLVQLGKKLRACPYYATRSLLEDADIVFCPYNYLIYPSIREQMMVNITNQVVILDEGHNMEDTAREAASLTVTSTQLADVFKEITELVATCLSSWTYKGLAASYQFFQALVQNLVQWMETTGRNLPQRSYEQACGIWSGEDFVPILHQMGVTPLTLGIISKHLEIMGNPPSDEEEVEEEPPMLGVVSMAVLKNLCLVLGFMLKDSMRFVQDYRICLMKVSTTRPVVPPAHGWRRRGPRAFEKVWIFSLNFWCLNPAVAFSELTCARSIILTSGTLSPMSSFASELGLAFPIQLEASHIIPESQTWIHSLSHGPSGNSLIANYQNSETYEFQDEVGLVVLRTCQVVPHGVLCFFSSYKMLEKLSKRWQETGLWAKITERKCLVSEPRSGEKSDFEEAMNTFYQVVRDCQGNSGSRTGALFLAVCRGKVSEGLDFANDNARAVITVGIPFPNVKDKQVELKREYNNEHCRKRGLLAGSEWYEIQAYRALNQALGRCLRHKKDWGALVLVDERFSKGPHYTKGLSKWVRQRLRHDRNFEDAMSSLRAFSESMTRASGDQSIVNGSRDETSTSLSVAADQTSAVFTSPTRPPLSSPHAPTTPSPIPHTSTPIAPGKGGRFLPPSVLPSQHQPPPSPLSSNRPPLPKPASVQLTLQEALSQQYTAMLSMSATRTSNPRGPPAFLYPGGVQLPVAEQQLSLADVTNLSTQPVEKDEGEETVVEPREDKGAQGPPGEEAMEMKPEGLEDKDNPSPVPESPLPPLSRGHSPLLFDSCPTTPGLKTTETVQHCPSPAVAAQPSPLISQPPSSTLPSPLITQLPPLPESSLSLVQPSAPQEEQLTKSLDTVDGRIEKEDIEDDDRTPPISPQKTIDLPPNQVLPCTPVVPPLLRDSSTEPSFGQPQRNVRVAKRKGARQVRVGSPVLVREEDRDFKSERGRTPRRRKNKAIVGDTAVITCRCGQALAKSSGSEKLELKEAFSKRYAGYPVAAVQASRLWTLLKGRSKKRTVNAYLVPSGDSHCDMKEGPGEYNAVWDESLGLCYSHLVCVCGETAGVKVHAATVPDGLVGKALFSSEKVTPC